MELMTDGKTSFLYIILNIYCFDYQTVINYFENIFFYSNLYL